MSNTYYKTKESVEEYIKLAKGIDGAYLIEKLNTYLPSNSRILEMGSGPGTDFQLLKKTYRVIGSDYSTEFLDRLKSSNPKDEFLNLDALTLRTNKKFDGIYSNKVLQHLSDEELQKSILRQTDLLNENGIVCHSFWKGEAEEVFKGLLVNYQTMESIKVLFENNYELILLEEYNEFEDGDSLLLLARKK